MTAGYQKRVAELQQQLPRLAWSAAEVAAQLGLTYDGVLAAVHAGEIAAIQIGRNYRIPDAELTRLVGEESRHTATPQQVGEPALQPPAQPE